MLSPLQHTEWAGYLTSKNFCDVAKRIQEMIGDEQPYVWVSTNELFGIRSEVRTNQVAESITFASESHLTVLDTYGVWGLSVGKLPEELANSKSCLTSPYVSFASRQLRIVQYAAGGNRIEWVIAPQEER